jgi:hypothetical protein
VFHGVGPPAQGIHRPSTAEKSIGRTEVAVRLPSSPWSSAASDIDIGIRLYQPGVCRASLPSASIPSYS